MERWREYFEDLLEENENEDNVEEEEEEKIEAVSYTHLDVYKRQPSFHNTCLFH